MSVQPQHPRPHRSREKESILSAKPHAGARPRPDHASFAEMGVPAPIVAVLAARGVTTPFPIQTATLPDALAGRDVLGRARTGSGKTIAFAVPVVQALLSAGHRRTPGRPGA